MTIKTLKTLIADLSDDMQIVEGPEQRGDYTKPESGALAEVSITVVDDGNGKRVLWVCPFV